MLVDTAAIISYKKMSSSRQRGTLRRSHRAAPTAVGDPCQLGSDRLFKEMTAAVSFVREKNKNMETILYHNPPTLDYTAPAKSSVQLLVIIDEPIATSTIRVSVGEHARAELFCWIRGRGTDTTTITLDLIHAGSHSTGIARVRAMLYDTSVNSVFGNVRIPKGAKEAESYFEYRAILFDKSRATATPALEIEEHPLKAGHAAAIGRIDEEQLFYLQSRGLSSEEASQLITQGFFEQLIAQITDGQKKEEVRNLLALTSVSEA